MSAVLLAVGVVCALTVLLALLILLVETFVADYGDVALAINTRAALTVRGGRPLLTTLKDEGVFIPSACGGRGSCGLCKVRVADGGGEPLATELPWLTPEDRARRVRLSCQMKVKQPLRIEIPEELFNVRQYRATVTGLTDLTHDIKEVRLKLVAPPALEFKAGQFVQFEVPPYALTDEPVYRAYSIASDPARQDAIELEIRLVPNGICTTYVHRHLKVGDAVTLNGPYGNFCLHAGEREIILIAGGSGMAPIKALLHQMNAERNPRRTRYYFGARSRRDLFLTDLMRSFERTLPDFRFVPALSVPAPGDAWTGETGLITDVVARHVAAPSQVEAYLCGSPGMIDACVKVLKGKGLTDERIFYDKF